MPLIDQIRLLDRLTHDRGARERFGRDRGPFLDGLDAEDRAAFAAADLERLAAFARDVAEKIHARWYRDRFPASLAAAALELREGPVDLVERVLAGEAFARRKGEDEDGVAFFSALLGLLRTGELSSPWMRDLLAYEYLCRCGLPRRAKGDSVDASLEAALLPQGTLRTSPPARRAPRGHLRLAAPVVAVAFDWPAAALSDRVLAAGELPVLPEPEATRALFRLGEESVDELAPVYPLHEIVDLVSAAPAPRAFVRVAFSDLGDEEVDDALHALLAAGFLTEGKS